MRFDVNFEFSPLKMTSKTHATVKCTSKLHIQNASVIDPLSGFRYLCQQLDYQVLCVIFLIASKIVESLRSYQEYPTKLVVDKQGEEFLIAALVKS
jgi:hypothetical protein